MHQTKAPAGKTRTRKRGRAAKEKTMGTFGGYRRRTITAHEIKEIDVVGMVHYIDT